MSVSSTLNISCGIAGLNINGNFDRTGTVPIGVSVTLPLADSGTITGGVITITGTPTVTTGTVDVFWTETSVNKQRLGCTATLGTSSDLTVTGGTGDTLPTGATAVTVQNETVYQEVAFDGTSLELLIVQCTQRCAIQFTDAVDVVLATISIAAASEVYIWTDGTTPINGTTTKIKMANAGIAAAGLQIGALIT